MNMRMNNDPEIYDNTYQSRLKARLKRSNWHTLNLDPWLMLSVLTLMTFGILILYSASNENHGIVNKQLLRLGLGFIILFVFAQIPPKRYYQWTPWVFFFGLFLLVAVLFVGQVQQGGRRWFALKIMNFQPSEIMKLATPMMVAWLLSNKTLPPKLIWVILSIFVVIAPAALTAKQPDLGTAIMIAMAGLMALILAGVNWVLVMGFLAGIAAAAPLLWQHMHDYQRKRILMLLNPESDPLGSGYHIIQSKIAMGSGGIFGKGWLQGSQSHLSFLPAHTTDFIFAVNGEELGFFGCALLLFIFLLILARCLYISIKAQSTYDRLLSGSLSLTFILCALVNVGMVIGILPVVGIPLPLVSYGGSSVLTIMASFGVIMSVHNHRTMWAR
jgi:rod shape determining protein RodA